MAALARGPGVIEIEECYELLRSAEIGHLAVLDDGRPYVVPISYLTTSLVGRSEPVVILRTRQGSTVDHALGPAALIVDHIDMRAGRAWSVLVRGDLVVSNRAHLAAAVHPWLAGRDRLLCLEPAEVSGRRFVAILGGAGARADRPAFAVEWGLAGAT